MFQNSTQIQCFFFVFALLMLILRMYFICLLLVFCYSKVFSEKYAILSEPKKVALFVFACFFCLEFVAIGKVLTINSLANSYYEKGSSFNCLLLFCILGERGN